MELVVFTVQIPAHICEERIIKNVESRSDSLSHWTVKELNQQFSGEFGWTKLESAYGVTALQYINRHLVRMIVRARDSQTARRIVTSFIPFVDAKTEHRRAYSRRCRSLQSMQLANNVATRKSLSPPSNQ